MVAPTLVTAASADELEVARLLTRAFHDNPAVAALYRGVDPERRRRCLDRTHRHFVRALLRSGEVTLAREGERTSGVLLGYPPGRHPPGAWSRVLVVAGPLLAGPRCALRYRALHDFMRAHRPREPHHYLFMMGVEPDRQGRGIGSALVRSVSERADGERVSCYLETDRAENVLLYERFGYRVVAHGRLARLGGLAMWAMTRPARAHGRGR